MGIDIARTGWIANKGLRILGGGMRLELPVAGPGQLPVYGLVRPRQDFDEVLARRAQKAGARAARGARTVDAARCSTRRRIAGSSDAASTDQGRRALDERVLSR